MPAKGKFIRVRGRISADLPGKIDLAANFNSRFDAESSWRTKQCDCR